MGLFYSANNNHILELIREKNQPDTKISIQDDENVIGEFVLNKEDRNDFNLKRNMPEDKILTLNCKLCGNDRFVVGQAEFFTAIKCEHCGYEIGIHEG